MISIYYFFGHCDALHYIPDHFFNEKANIFRLKSKLAPVLDRGYVSGRFTINLIMQMCKATVTLNDDFTPY